jgi:hypothetical protein
MRLGLCLSLVALGCVEPEHGSRIIANFQALGPPGAVLISTDPANLGKPPFVQLTTPHYEMWATIREDLVVDLLAFDVVPSVDINSPCLMYDATAEQAYNGEVKAGQPVMPGFAFNCDHADCTGAQADQYWIATRSSRLYTGNFAVTSPSDGFQGGTTLDLTMCDDSFMGNPWEPALPMGTPLTTCWLDHAAIVPGTFSLSHGGTLLQPSNCAAAPDSMHYCLEPSSGRVTFLTSIKNGMFVASYRAHLSSGEPKVNPINWSNANRLRACALPTQGGANPYYDPNFYIGNIIQLSAPRSGQFYGLVDMLDPNAGLPLGGVSVLAPYGLSQATEIFITVEDHSVGAPDPNIGNRVDAKNRGPVVIVGKTDSGDTGAGRGVMTANLIAPQNVSFPGMAVPGGHVSVYLNLDDDPVQF